MVDIESIVREEIAKVETELKRAAFMEYNAQIQNYLEAARLAKDAMNIYNDVREALRTQCETLRVENEELRKRLALYEPSEVVLRNELYEEIR